MQLSLGLAVIDQSDNELVWLIVGILAIIALLLYIVRR